MKDATLDNLLKTALEDGKIKVLGLLLDELKGKTPIIVVLPPPQTVDKYAQATGLTGNSVKYRIQQGDLEVVNLGSRTLVNSTQIVLKEVFKLVNELG